MGKYDDLLGATTEEPAQGKYADLLTAEQPEPAASKYSDLLTVTAEPSSAPRTEAAVAATQALAVGAQQSVNDQPSQSFLTAPSPQFLQPFETAVRHNIEPIIQHPLQSAYEMFVPTKENTYEPLKQMFTDPAKAFSRDTPVGSQKWWDEFVGFTAPLVLGAAGKAFPKAVKPVESLKAEPASLPSGVETKVQGTTGGSIGPFRWEPGVKRESSASPETLTPPEPITRGAPAEVKPASEQVPDFVLREAREDFRKQHSWATDREAYDAGVDVYVEQRSQQYLESLYERGLRERPAKGAESTEPPAPVETPSGPEAQPPRVTSIKNEVVDSERVARGQPELMKEAKRDFGTAWDEAMAKIDQDPTYQDRLVNELRENPRGIEDHEVAALTHKQVELNNQFDKTANELVKAHEAGDSVKAGELEVISNDTLSRLNELNEITTSVGSVQARGLNARKMLLNEDFSLAKMILKKRAARGGKPLTPEETVQISRQAKQIADLDKKIEAAKKRVITNTEKLRGRISERDFAKRERTKLNDPELMRLQFEYSNVRQEFLRGVFEDQLKQRSLPEKLLGNTREVINTSRAIITSADLSAVLRQGGITALTHPIKAAKAVPSMFKALASEKGQFKVEQEIRNRPNYTSGKYQQGKLYLADENATSLSKMEEAYMSRWAGKIPVIAATQRAYLTYLNRIRADVFDGLERTLGRGGKLTTPELQAVGNFVNVTTGRGDLGAVAKGAVNLNTAFFAPRYVASRFQFLLGQPIYRGGKASPRVRNAIAKEYARFLIGAGTVYGLAKLAGADIETDSRSSDFGKIKIGNTRIDLMSGLSQTSVFLTRFGTGETKNQRGEVVPITGEDKPFGTGSTTDVTFRFLRSKLAPLPGFILDVREGENVVGEPVTPIQAAERLYTPLSVRDIYEAIQEQGVDKGTAMGLLAIFGAGVQTYQEKGGSSKPRTNASAKVHP